MKLERKFSQELAPDLREETACRLREARNKPESYEDLKKSKSPEFRPELEEIKQDIWGRIFKTEKHKEMINNLNINLKFEKERNIEEAWEYYHQELNRIMSECPLSPEERDEYLSTEALSKMSLENYLFLLKRLSGEAFYHITRYGVRENTFMSTGGGHDMGEGKFVNSFIPLLKDGKINSMTSTILKNQRIDFLNEKEITKLITKGHKVDDIVEKVMGAYGSM